MRGTPEQKYEDWIGSESWKDGQKSEESFGDLLREKYSDARAATLEEQYKGIDWVCSRGSIDVKAMKKVQRGGKVDPDIIWIEFRNNAGDEGWIYGEQDWIAFEKPEAYVICKREDLMHLAEWLCNLNKRVDKAKDALYKGYTRKNRKDLISMIRFSDLSKITTSELKKNGSLL